MGLRPVGRTARRLKARVDESRQRKKAEVTATVIELGRPVVDIACRGKGYVLISHPDFLDALEPLIQAR